MKKNKINSTLSIYLRAIAVVVIITAFVCVCVFGATFISLNNRINNIDNFVTTCSAKNVILLIGDGMGENHLNATKAYYNIDKLYMESLASKSGYAKTYSKNSEVTDSAAGATALSTGKKTNNGCVAYLNGNNIENMTEYAKSLGKCVGIIATETLTGATPAGFSAHSSSRNNTDEIALSEFKSGVDIFMGAGVSYYNNKTTELAENGYTYVTDTSEINDSLLSANKVFASFNDIARYNKTKDNDSAKLIDLSTFAINFLSAKSGDNGFFLMIEASHIDKRSHKQDMVKMVEELRAFDETIKAVVELSKIIGNTAVFVTADHETGGITYDEASGYHFTIGNHTATNVKWFAYLKAEDVFSDGDIIDNTNISQAIRQIMKNYFN